MTPFRFFVARFRPFITPGRRKVVEGFCAAVRGFWFFSRGGEPKPRDDDSPSPFDGPSSGGDGAPSASSVASTGGGGLLKRGDAPQDAYRESSPRYFGGLPADGVPSSRCNGS